MTNHTLSRRDAAGLSARVATILLALAAAISVAGPTGLAAQEEMSPKGGGDPDVQDPLPTPRGSDNIEVVAHVPLGAEGTAADMEFEQAPDRRLAYVARRAEFGVTAVSFDDPENPEVVWDWRIENEALHRGRAPDVKYFAHEGRYYVVQSFQFQQGGPDANLGAIVFDVTELPDGEVEEEGRITYPEPGGFHNIFTYAHSDGRPLLIATTTGDHAAVFDMAEFLDGADDQGKVAEIRLPENPLAEALGYQGYHDFYVGWHPESGQDRFYGGGGGGWFVFDVTDLQDPRLLATVTGVPGVLWGHTITPGPRGRYFVGETEYQYAPLRIFDLQPALDGEQENVRLPISAWTADWRNLSHNHEVRWPYVFVAAYEDGLQVFNMRDPENPFTVGYFDTFDGRHKTGGCADNICNGAFGVDVRNHDGLIGISDKASGFWLFRMEGFAGWSGEEWGVPDVSSVQDWDEAPGGS
jgi:hypothetical protein